MYKCIFFVLFCYLNLYSQYKDEINYKYEYTLSSFDTIQRYSNNFILRSEKFQQNHSALNILGQFVVGTALETVFMVIPAGISFGLAFGGKSTVTTDVILSTVTLSAYLFGPAIGAYWIGKAENKNLSFWKTFSYSAIGGGVGIILVAILAKYYKNIPAAGGLLAFAMPVIGSVTYTSIFAEWQQVKNSSNMNSVNISHKEVMEQSMLFEIKLIRISL